MSCYFRNPCSASRRRVTQSDKEPTDTSKQPIRTRYLGHVTGHHPIRDQYFLTFACLPARLGEVERYHTQQRYTTLTGPFGVAVYHGLLLLGHLGD
eukprot:sb/3479218/